MLDNSIVDSIISAENAMTPNFNHRSKAPPWRDATVPKRIFASLIALCGWSALAVHFSLSMEEAASHGTSMGEAMVNYFSYFTILTNILVATCLTLAAFDADNAKVWNWPSIVASLTLYIVVVSIIYATLLEKAWHPQGLKLVADRALHDVIPVCPVAYWLICVPKGSLRWADPLLWLPYPFLYMGYTLARGAATGHYPYPFLDVTRLSYSGVFLNGLLLLALFSALGMLLVFIDRTFHSHATRETNF